jgi:hypothetical protein
MAFKVFKNIKGISSVTSVFESSTTSSMTSGTNSNMTSAVVSNFASSFVSLGLLSVCLLFSVGAWAEKEVLTQEEWTHLLKKDLSYGDIDFTGALDLEVDQNLDSDLSLDSGLNLNPDMSLNSDMNQEASQPFSQEVIEQFSERFNKPLRESFRSPYFDQNFDQDLHSYKRVQGDGGFCLGQNPHLGMYCSDGTYHLGNFKGARYFTTPSHCQEIPSSQYEGSCPGPRCHSLDSFEGLCSGVTSDTLDKTWNNGTRSWYDIRSLRNQRTSLFDSSTATSESSLKFLESLESIFSLASKNGSFQSGEWNTKEIMNHKSFSVGGPYAAASYCDKMIFAGYDDWFLPSREELDLFRQLGRIYQDHLGVDISGQTYWSSTEFSSRYAWVQNFSQGEQLVMKKNTPHKVRCVRRIHLETN